MDQDRRKGGGALWAAEDSLFWNKDMPCSAEGHAMLRNGPKARIDVERRGSCDFLAQPKKLELIHTEPGSCLV